MRGKSPHIALALIALALAMVYWPTRLAYPIDDTFITFRYADNLAHGFGLVWNAGGPPTEGYTNFLYVLLLAPFALLKFDLLLVSQILNVVAITVTAIYVFKLAKGLTDSDGDWIALIPSILYLAMPATWANALSGMETVVFGALVIAAVYHSLAGRPAFMGYFLFFLAALTRPEGAVIAVIVAAFQLFRLNPTQVVKSFLLFFALPLLLYYVSKRLYFGHWLPNSFAVKVVQAAGDERSFFQGLQAVKLFLLRVWPLLILAIVPLLFERSWRILCVLCCALLMIAAYSVPAPLMGFFDRFFYSSEVLLFALAGVGLILLHKHLGSQQTILAGGVILALFMFSNTQSPRAKEIIAWDLRDINKSLHLIAQDIGSLPHAKQIVFASSDAGILPYVSGLKHFDLAGLNETLVAHARTAEEVIDRILTARPDIVILSADWPSPGDTCRIISRSVHGKLSTAVNQLLTEPRFQQYRPVAAYPTGLYEYAVLLNTQSPVFSALDSAFGSRVQSKSALITPLSCIN